MLRFFLIVAFVACSFPSVAWACGTCRVEDGASNQILMLVAMLSIPVVAVVIGYQVIRRLLARLEES